MPKPAPNSCRDCHRPIRWTPGISWVHSDPPAEAVRAAERAVRDGVSIRLGKNALALAQRGELVLLSSTETETAARLALEAGGPHIAAQARLEERARIVAHLRAITDDDGVRRFLDRHDRLRGATSVAAVMIVAAVLLAAVDEIKNSETPEGDQRV